MSDAERLIPEAYPGDPEVTIEMAAEFGLSEEEFELILGHLGRAPTFTELGIYSVMWSEHASYKNSISQLKTLPRSGGKLLVDAGEENAGLVDIGDNLAVAFKIESHNHPSAVEPYQGAATGVGGILRDIFTMGARPIAALNSLRFGNPRDERVRFLVEGVVKGIADYGNCFGVPTVGGEVIFEDAYAGNPLVNAMAVGLVKHDKVMRADASGEGNPVIYVGARTGRDGIHGATFASVELTEESESRKSNVQVGDPFTEKLLLEATLELAESGAVVGIQDMGAAGLTCSSSEMAAKDGVGMILNLDKVPRRETNMTPYEVMLSESQERMLLVAKRGQEHKVFEIFEKWDLEAEEVGEITATGKLQVFQDGIMVASIPPVTLALGGDAPVYERDASRPSYINKVKNLDGFVEPTDNNETLLTLLARPNIASKRWVYRQYDYMVRTNTRVIPGGGDAAVVRVPGTKKALGIATDCNGRFVYLDPRKGTAMAVAESARNVACSGASPLGVTNCLNFGNPYKPEMFWTFKEAIAGMGEACRALGTPVTGGNVSFYNESPTGAVFPSPVIGVVGIAEDAEKTIGMALPGAGYSIYLLGSDDLSWAGSEVQMIQDGIPKGTLPELNLELESNLQEFVIKQIQAGLVHAAHDLAEGGLLVALTEMAIANDDKPIGFELLGDSFTVSELFAEGPSRVLLAVRDDESAKLEELVRDTGLELSKIAKSGGNTISGAGLNPIELSQLIEVYYGSLERELGYK